MVIQVPDDDVGPNFKSRARRDNEDLNLEKSGLETGRMARFLVGDKSVRTVEERKKKEEAQRFYSLLEMLLREDARYAKLYHEVRERLERAHQAVDSALIDIKQRLEASDRKLQKLRNAAAELPDGRKVFRSSIDNALYSEDGQRLNERDAQKVKIPEGALSWEEYAREAEKRHQLRQDTEEAERYRDEVLKPAQDRLNDRDNPPSMEELDAFNRRIDHAMPNTVARHLSSVVTASRSQSAAHTIADATKLSVPDLHAHFDTVRVTAPGVQADTAPGVRRAASPLQTP